MFVPLFNDVLLFLMVLTSHDVLVLTLPDELMTDAPKKTNVLCVAG